MRQIPGRTKRLGWHGMASHGCSPEIPQPHPTGTPRCQGAPCFSISSCHLALEQLGLKTNWNRIEPQGAGSEVRRARFDHIGLDAFQFGLHWSLLWIAVVQLRFLFSYYMHVGMCISITAMCVSHWYFYRDDPDRNAGTGSGTGGSFWEFDRSGFRWLASCGHLMGYTTAHKTPHVEKIWGEICDLCAGINSDGWFFGRPVLLAFLRICRHHVGSIVFGSCCLPKDLCELFDAHEFTPKQMKWWIKQIVRQQKYIFMNFISWIRWTLEHMYKDVNKQINGGLYQYMHAIYTRL